MSEEHEYRKLTKEELDGLAGEELPERAAMSLINANVAAPVNLAAALNVASDNSIAYANAQKLDGGLNGDQEAKVWDYYKDTNFFGVNGGICFDNITQFAKLNWTIGSLPKPLPGRKDWLNDTFAKAYLKAHNQKPTAC